MMNPLEEIQEIDKELSDIHSRLSLIFRNASDEQREIITTAFVQIFDLKGDTLTELRKLFKK